MIRNNRNKSRNAENMEMVWEERLNKTSNAQTNGRGRYGYAPSRHPQWRYLALGES